METRMAIALVLLLLCVGLVGYALLIRTSETQVSRISAATGVVSAAAALVVFLAPGSGGSKPTVGDVSGGTVIQSGGPISGQITVGETGADRGRAALEEVQREFVDNAARLSAGIVALSLDQPRPLGLGRRKGEDAVSYHRRTREAWAAWATAIERQVAAVRPQDTVLTYRRRDLSTHEAEAVQVEASHRMVLEGWAALDRYAQVVREKASEPAGNPDVSIEAVERSWKTALIDAKVGLTAATGNSAPNLDPLSTANVSGSLAVAGVETGDAQGAALRSLLLQAAAELFIEKAEVLRDEIDSPVRSVPVSISDPYLLRLRELAGLGRDLSPSEVARLQNTTIDVAREAQALALLAVESYLAGDVEMAVEYLARARVAPDLPAELQEFFDASIARIDDPARFGGALGVLVLRIDESAGLFRAGVRVGDVIVLAGDSRVDEPTDLALALAGRKGDTVPVMVVRRAETHIFQVERGFSAGASVTQLVILAEVQL